MILSHQLGKQPLHANGVTAGATLWVPFPGKVADHVDNASFLIITPRPILTFQEY